MPAAWKTAVEGRGEVRSVVADQELHILQLLAEGVSEVAGLLHSVDGAARAPGLVSSPWIRR